MHKTFKVTAKTQADGAQVVSLAGSERAYHHQVQVDVSSVPAAGTMDVAIRTPGAAEYVSLGTINLVAGPRAVMFDGYADSIRLTPASFDTGKSYSAFIFSLQV